MAQGSEVGLVSLQKHTHTHTEQLTASLPLVSGEVLHTEPLCPPPKTHTAVPEGWILCLSSLPLPPPSLSLPLSSFSFSSFFISSAKQIPSSRSHLSVPTLSPRASAISSHTPSLLLVSFSFFFSALLVLVTQSISKQSLAPST